MSLQRVSVTKNCRLCSIRFETVRSHCEAYCSRECRAERDRTRARVVWQQKRLEGGVYLPRTCRLCKKDIYVSPGTKRKIPGKYCSRVCRQRAYWMNRTFHVTVENYRSILEMQDWGCKICGGRGEKITSWHIDHDHACCPTAASCGRCIRGLLCGRCNRLLGQACDDVKILQSAISYLQEGVIR